MVRFSPSKLKDARKKSRLSCQNLSKKTGGIVEQSYINKLENGHKEQPSIDKIYALAKALSISFLELLDLDEYDILELKILLSKGFN